MLLEKGVEVPSGALDELFVLLNSERVTLNSVASNTISAETTEQT
jgi:hypothetical protein